jgi:hypothetical protein
VANFWKMLMPNSLMCQCGMVSPRRPAPATIHFQLNESRLIEVNRGLLNFEFALIPCVNAAGEVRVQNAVLKTSAFDDLGLPVTVVHGTIDLLELRIPWASLQTSPVTVLVHNVNILLGPNTKEPGQPTPRIPDVLSTVTSRPASVSQMPRRRSAPRRSSGRGDSTPTSRRGGAR